MAQRFPLPNTRQTLYSSFSFSAWLFIYVHSFFPALLSVFTRSLYIALALLEFTLQTGLILKFSTCLYLLSARTKGIITLPNRVHNLLFSNQGLLKVMVASFPLKDSQLLFPYTKILHATLINSTVKEYHDPKLIFLPSHWFLGRIFHLVFITFSRICSP